MRTCQEENKVTGAVRAAHYRRGFSFYAYKSIVLADALFHDHWRSIFWETRQSNILLPKMSQLYNTSQF